MNNTNSTLQLEERYARVRWADAGTSDLPYLWLRDNCLCSECRIEQTSEKKFILTSVATDLRPEKTTLIDGVLEVLWPDGHRSHYAEAELRAIPRSAQFRWTPWDGGFVPHREDYRRFQRDDDSASAAIESFIDSGALVLTDAPTTPNSLEDLARRLGPIRELLFDRIHDVEVDASGYNVAHTALPLPPHNDFASYSWPPSVQALHMLVNDTPGGQSIIVDGWAVLSGLRSEFPALFQALCTMPVPFREFDENNETFAVAPIVSCDAQGNIERFRFSNQLMQPIDPNRDGVDAFYRAYHELCCRVSDESVQAKFRLSGGEVLIVASHRVLHGREAFEPVGRRHLQDAYFEFDNVRNHLVVLARAGELR